MKVPPEFESVFQSVELTEREIGFLTWLAGGDSRTVENLKSLIQNIRATRGIGNALQTIGQSPAGGIAMRHQYTRQELESITQETAIYIEGSGIAQLQWGGLEIAQGVKDGYLYCKHIKPFAMDLYGQYWTAFDGLPEESTALGQETNADRIRAISDEELATMLNRFAEGEDAPRYCRNLPECDADMEADSLIPLERCQACLLHWLQQPAEGDVSGAR